MKSPTCSVLVTLLILWSPVPGGAAPAAPLESGDDYWVEAMAETHAKFTGRNGTFAHFGDSITVTLAFWTPLLYSRKNAPPQMERAYELVSGYIARECWRDWKGGQFGNDGGRTIRWAYNNVDDWLRRLNPEAALIMFGTNDLNSVGLEDYEKLTRMVVRKCLDNGTIVILSTIPPRHGFVEKAAAYANAVRKIARDMKVPLIDFHTEILKRRPDDWDGASEKFLKYRGYDVPTLLARDGVHPSNPAKWQNDYSENGLRCSGYVLRNYLALTKYADVIEKLNLVGPSPPKVTEVEPEPPGAALNAPAEPWFPKAPALPPPTGPTVRVANVQELVNAIGNAKPGQTILVADGHYMMPHYVEIRADNVTLRGASGRRERVIIDGARSREGELVGVRRCSGVTIADLTIQNITYNGFKINSETNVQNLTIHNCIIHNIWQRGVKGVKVPSENREAIRPRNCRIRYCLFYNDRPKRLTDDSHDIAGGNYVGAIDIMYAAGWTISDNVFVGIRGRTREGRGAVFIWFDSQDCLVERNIIIDCDAGICFGNAHRPEGTIHHCSGCIARNNFITRAPEGGIVTVYTRDCKILNNSIYDPDNRLGRLIRLVLDNDGLLVANNLLCGPKIRNESKSRITFTGNLQKNTADWFVDPEAGDLHLRRQAAEAVDKAVRPADVTYDIDRQLRDTKPDIGADESAR